MSTDTDTRNDDTRREDSRQDAAKSPEQLEREVDQARARLGQTASALSDRLSPGELIDQALGMAREHGGEFGRNLGAQVKNNPMPMILTSVGISWMMLSGTKSNGPAPASGTNTAKDDSKFADAVGGVAASSREKGAAIGERLDGATATVKESAQNMRESLVQFYRDQPLLAGSLGIAIGAALGALVPPTEIEDRMPGEVRDRSVDAAKSGAARTYYEVRESVRPG